MIGRTLSHYRILEEIGRGGMGQVYAAEDTKLGRKVALKILPPEMAESESRRKRFEREARTVASLNHPNIVHVYSVEQAENVYFITMELVRGKSLAELIPKTGLTVRRFFKLAIPLAEAVAAAHEARIIHRDLKPGNVMVTEDGRVKVLDFGLAKPRSALAAAAASELPTETKTEEGVLLGTVGYMAPEQASGQDAGPRADIFALGILMWEMLSGAAPFRRDTGAETLTAILKEDPPSLPASVPPALDRIVRRCLEKRPEDRFHSAHDVRVALEAFSEGSGPISGVSAAPPAPGVSRRQILAGGAAALGLFAVGVGTGTLLRRRWSSATTPSFHRLTFRRGMIRTARFGPDYQTVLYGALWDGDVCRIYTVRAESPESAPLSLPPSTPLAVSPSGELALALGDHRRGIMTYGTLARVPLAGGAPRELLEDVKYADWSPDGSALALVRRADGREQLEFPMGNVVAEPAAAGGGFSFPRVSPEGDRVAFFELAAAGWLTGNVATVDRRGNKKIISQQYFNVFGLAWNGDEVWFTAADDRPLFRNAIHAIRPDGRARVLVRIAGNASLHDLSPDGRILVARTDDRSGIAVLAPGETQERDLSWLDAPVLADISRDGTKILFTENGVGGGPHGSVYFRSTTGSPAVRLGNGRAIALSPDARWALAGQGATREPSPYLDVLPTGPGRPRRIEHPRFTYSNASWLRDGGRVLVRAREPDRDWRLYVIELNGGAPDPVTPEEVLVGSSWAPSPDSTTVAVASDRGVALYPVSGGQPRTVPDLSLRGRLLAWIEGGLLVSDDPNPQALQRVFRIDPASGRRELWKEIEPRDPAGIMNVRDLVVTPDGRSYGYGWHRALSDLYLVDGLN